MDNHEFDFLIAQKLSEIEPEFDPQAWKDMDQMLESVSPLPWYQRPNYKVLAIAATLFTLLNAGLLFFNVTERTKIEKLSVSRIVAPDLSSFRPNLSSFELPEVLIVGTKRGFIKTEAKRPVLAKTTTNTNQPYNQVSSSIWLQKGKKELGQETINDLVPEDLTSLPIPSISAIDFSALKMQGPSGVDPVLVEGLFTAEIPEDYYYKEKETSIASRFGFTTGMNQQYGDLGDMYMAPRNGLISEFSLRKDSKISSLKLLVGATISKVNYGLNNIDEDLNVNEKLTGFPGVDLSVNRSAPIPERVRVQNELVQFPIYLKYQAAVSNKFSVFASAGPTLDILASQRFTYSFINIEGGQVVDNELIERVSKSSLYLGSLGSALGLEYRITPWLAAQSELNYRYGLEPVGVEKRDISAFSLNFNFLFKIK